VGAPQPARGAARMQALGGGTTSRRRRRFLCGSAAARRRGPWPASCEARQRAPCRVRLSPWHGARTDRELILTKVLASAPDRDRIVTECYYRGDLQSSNGILQGDQTLVVFYGYGDLSVL
jgi:hypothetical protein